MSQLFRRVLILKGIKIALLVQELRWFCWIGGFCLLGASAVKGLLSTVLPCLVSVGIGAYSNGWKHYIASPCKLLMSTICLDDSIGFDPITGSWNIMVNWTKSEVHIFGYFTIKCKEWCMDRCSVSNYAFNGKWLKGDFFCSQRKLKYDLIGPHGWPLCVVSCLIWRLY